MKFEKSYSVEEITNLVKARYTGDTAISVLGINELHCVQRGDITFVDHEKYYKKVLNSNASVIIIDKEVPCPEGKALIISENPFRDYNYLTEYFRPVHHPATNAWHNPAKNILVGEGTIIYPGVYIAENVFIGTNCIIYPNVSIYQNSVIGNNVIIHSNSVIGGDAFYYKKVDGEYNKMFSCGRTILHDNVEVGCGTTIDRGVSADTIIGDGTKIDNQVQIGHDTTIGKNCIIGSLSGIAGVTTVGNNVIIWGQVGVTKDIVIEDDVVVLAQSGVGGRLEKGKTYFGSPCKESRAAWRELSALSKLPELIAEKKL